MKTKAQMVAILAEAFPTGKFKDAAEFYDRSSTGIWIKGDFDIDGEPAVDGWADGYVFGAHPKLSKLCEDNGWFVEPYDAGTMMVFPK